MATRGRPPIIEKATLPLSDGSEIVLRLIGDGKTAQIELPDQWTLANWDRSDVADAGRSRISFVSTKRGKAKGARPAAPAAAAAAKPAATPAKPAAKRAPAKKAAAAPAKKTAAKSARTRKPAAKKAADAA